MPGQRQTPETTKNELQSAQVKFLTFILAYSRRMPNADIDGLGEEMLADMDFDLSPYPDFRSMRLALEPLCDVDTFQLMRKSHGQAGTAMAPAVQAIVEEVARKFGTPGVVVEAPETWQSPHFFIGHPQPGKKITWQADLAEFMAVVAFYEQLGVKAGKEPSEARGEIYRQLRSFMDVDLEDYPDFGSVYDDLCGCLDSIDVPEKSSRLKKARKVALQRRSPDGKMVLTGFMVQASYNANVAGEFASRCPDLDPLQLALAFDLIYISEMSIVQLLGC